MKNRRPIGVKPQRGKARAFCRCCQWWGTRPTLGEAVDLGLGHLVACHA